MKMTSNLTSEVVQFARKSRKFALHNAALAAVTVLTGAYVAGNDAGRAYNTFPKMGDDWLPPKEDLFPLQPLWRNFVETTGLVQFDHRVMAISTASAITLMYAQARRALQGQYWQQIPKTLRFGYNASMGMVLVQVGLGISTLLMYVPTELAAAHQAGAIVLLTMLTGLVHTLGFSKYGKKLANPVVVQKVAGLVNKKFL
jgi:cytochrome c oxidase assembly protein subunit 15